MLSLMTGWLLALVLGVRHASEPDHVAAVSTLIAGTTSARRAAWLGAIWGLGHSLALLLVGVALMWLHLQMGERVAALFELAVACMLLVLGTRSILRAIALRRSSRLQPVAASTPGHAVRRHTGQPRLENFHASQGRATGEPERASEAEHSHAAVHAGHSRGARSHAGLAHSHATAAEHRHATSDAHSHAADGARPHAAAAPHSHAADAEPHHHPRPLLIGLVHGVAGSGALTALALANMPSFFTAVVYIVCFGAGSVLGMMALTGLAGVPLARIGQQARAQAWLFAGAGAASLVLGVLWGWPLLDQLRG